MPLIDHLIELRRRLIYSILALLLMFLVGLYFATPIFNFLLTPLRDIGVELVQFTALQERFFVNVRIAFFFGAFVSFPLVATQLWMFVAPGLYEHEQAAFRPFLIATPMMFALGGAFAYYLVIPVAWQFFAGFESAGGDTGVQVELIPRTSEYLSLVMTLIFAFGIAFLTPVILALLVRAGIISTQLLAEKRRYAIVLVFVAAAILTPPDPLSQIGLAIPMLILYEVAILIGKRIERARAKRLAAEEALADADL